MSIVFPVAKSAAGSIVSGVVKTAPTPPASYCSLMSWTTALQTNCTGVFDDIELTVTNTGGAGQFFATGDTSWTSSTGTVSGELRFKSDTGTNSHNLIIVQGATTICGLSFNNTTKTLFDSVAMSNVETGLTGGADYTFNVVLNQTAGTATYKDSE